MTGALVLAAGAARRFGAPKQLAELDGRPLLEHALAAVAGARGVGRTVVVLGAGAAEVNAGVDLHGAEVVVCAGWEEGQAASLRAGAAALAAAGADAAVVVLGDQPRITSAAIERVLGARAPARFDAVRASYSGRPGHPVVLERSLLDQVPVLAGDEGARSLIARARVRDVACDGLGSPDDVDTPEQLEVLKA